MVQEIEINQTVQGMLQPGSMFVGRYQVESFLGSGDRKHTYLAFDQKMDRQVALCIIKAESVTLDPDGTWREGRVLGKIGSHDNVVSLYDFEIDRADGSQYMVFEFLSGGTLGDYVNKRGKLPPDDLLRFARQLCRGLSHLHSRGIVHRDLSPQNVWLDERNVAHLGDFDSAVPFGYSGESRPLTTNSFAAPEEFDGSILDNRSDLFSFGRLLYVLATGEIRSGDPLEIYAIRKDLPSLFVDLVSWLLRESPEDRPNDADEVLEMLEKIRYSSNLEAIISGGESETVEFKSSLIHPYGEVPEEMKSRLEAGQINEKQIQSEIRKELARSVTKTVAAFLNSKGGTLLIGVDDSGGIIGIEADFTELAKRQNADGWLQHLKYHLANALGKEVLGQIYISLVSRDDKTVAVVTCSPRDRETWHVAKDKGGEDVFYYRSLNSTEELKGSVLVSYVRTRW